MRAERKAFWLKYVKKSFVNSTPEQGTGKPSRSPSATFLLNGLELPLQSSDHDLAF